MISLGTATEAKESVMSYTGTVQNGVIVLDNGTPLPEGTRVQVTVAAPEGTLGQRLLQLAGLAKGLPEDMAENHDHYLHGRPKK
jgi:hypothetical protein